MDNKIKSEKLKSNDKMKYEKPKLVKLGDEDISIGDGPLGNCSGGFIAVG